MKRDFYCDAEFIGFSGVRTSFLLARHPAEKAFPGNVDILFYPIVMI